MSLTSLRFWILFLTSFLILVLLFSAISPGDRDFIHPRLQLDQSGALTIAIFADLHYGEEENGWGIDQDIKSTHVMRNVLGMESPSLAVINGDFITGENTFRENSTEYVHRIVAPLVAHDLPWASTYGNHDSKFNLSREALFQTETSYPQSLTRQMDPSLPGMTNYYLLIYGPPSGNEERPVAVLWFFDSRGGASYQHEPANEDDIPNWVAPETARWFSTQHQNLKADYGILLSLAFVHIPPHAFLDAQKGGLDPSHFPGVNDDVPVAIQGKGSEDTAFVDALLATEGLHSIYVGHDHGNAWCSTWPGREKAPFLCCSKHSAYGGYGTWNRGVRMVRISFGDGAKGCEVETWVRMENGDIVSRVSLNETYGIDVYPTADGE
ncbi:calcineurin-like phosphoesterase [Pseudomassariella vexata]|uniref:Calcineurin-like phosphoesterase n=1 Tax=Pseudomassariella vexata TaxID=1141098 RepID=A0A1Y2EFL8_9PEZI|nr:calcineurin-like phosphoesterase [Pseudomassariella vexata]ORY70056.1 calcineurin-like phosphoesterase [Pseudomassariella vexata]